MLKYCSYLLFLFALSFSFSVKAFKVPDLTGPVIDEVNLLSSSAKVQIADQLYQIRQNGGPQIQVFITASLQGESTEEVAIQIFDKWKLGEAKKDNGLLFLIAPNEKKMRIEVGRGLEGDIPDVIAKRIISDVVSPFFKRKEFDFGVSQGIAALSQYLNATPEQKMQMQQKVADNKSDKIPGPLKKYAFFIILGIWILLFMFNPSLALYILFSLFNGGGGRGGGGSSHGGWSGGGGGSSGGGASGDW